MRVGINREQVNVDGQGKFVSDFEILFSRRNIEPRVILKLQQHRRPSRWFRSEIETDAWLNHFWLPRGLQMRVQDEVGALVQTQRHALRLNVRHSSRLPEEQVTVRIENLRFDSDLHPAKSGASHRFPAPQRS